jgi:hypothetical protein
VELHDQRIGRLRVFVMVKNLGQITSDKNKVSRLQIFNVRADHSASSTFSYKSEFDLGMEMPPRS